MLCIIFVIIGICHWFFTYLGTAFFAHVGENVTYQLRVKYLRALL